MNGKRLTLLIEEIVRILVIEKVKDLDRGSAMNVRPSARNQVRYGEMRIICGAQNKTFNLFSLLPSAPKSGENIARRSPFFKTAHEKKLEVGAVDLFSQDHLESQFLVHV